MLKKLFVNKKRHINYILYTPNVFSKNLPLIIYLHGAGERGKNIEHLSRHGLVKDLEEGLQVKAVILCPQCPADLVWDNVTIKLKKLIDRIVKKYHIDKKRVTVTGSSMGGFGTWMLGMSYPNFFAGIAPIAGGGMEWRAGNLKNTVVKAYHGANDKDVLCERSKFMTDAVNKAGGKAQLIVLQDFGHNDAIDYVYKNTDIIEWLLSQSKSDKITVKEHLFELF